MEIKKITDKKIRAKRYKVKTEAVMLVKHYEDIIVSLSGSFSYNHGGVMGTVQPLDEALTRMERGRKRQALP